MSIACALSCRHPISHDFHSIETGLDAAASGERPR
jgi:hypothetical protein